MPELKQIASAKLPTPFAEFTVHAFKSGDGKEHLAIALGELGGDPPLVRVHSECLTGDVGSSRVDLQACKLEYSIVSPK